jgi:hypothetical protein
MADDLQDSFLPLGRAATVVLHLGGEKRRYRVDTANLTPRGKKCVRLTFEGPQGSVMIDLPRTVFWRLTCSFHERSTAADFSRLKQPGRLPRRKRT